MSGVVVPNGPTHQGLLDTVMKGLAVAKDVYGIRADQLAIARAEDEQAGIMPGQDQAALAKSYNFSQTQTPGSVPQKFRTGEGDEGVTTAYLTPKQAPAKIYPVANVSQDGKTGTAFINPNNKDNPVVSFVETQKPEKDNYTTITITNPDGSQTIKRVAANQPGEWNSSAKPAKAEDEEKLYSEVMGKREPTRGNRAVQQTSLNLVNIGNAKALIQPYANNLDAMPQKQVALLTEELGKIATGGVGSESGRKSIEAETFNSRWQNFLAQVNNEPQPAQLGAFLKDNVAYLNDLEKSNQDVLDRYHKNVWNSNKNRLSEDLQARAKQEFPDYFGWDKQAQPGAAGGMNAVASKPDLSGQAMAGTSANAGGAHPQDSAAVTWANKNILSPDPKVAAQARTILNLNGAK